MGCRRSGLGRELQDLRDRRALLGDQGPHDRRRLRPRRNAEAARGRVRPRRQARRGGRARRRQDRPPRRALWRAQPAADGQARRGGCGRLSVGAPHRRGNRRGAAPLRRRATRRSRARRRWSSAILRPSTRWARRPSPRQGALRLAASISSRAKPGSSDDCSRPDAACRNPQGRQARRGRSDRLGPCRSRFWRGRGSAELPRAARQHRDDRADMGRPDLRRRGDGALARRGRSRRPRRRQARRCAQYRRGRHRAGVQPRPRRRCPGSRRRPKRSARWGLERRA